MKGKTKIVSLLGSVLHYCVTCLTAADMKCKVSANVKTIGPHFTLCWLLPTAAGDNANGRAAAKLQPLRLVIEFILISDEPDSNGVLCLSIRMCSLPLLRGRTADCLCVWSREGSGQITLLLWIGESVKTGLGSRHGIMGRRFQDKIRSHKFDHAWTANTQG